jgi:hypothetical protein
LIRPATNALDNECFKPPPKIQVRPSIVFDKMKLIPNMRDAFKRLLADTSGSRKNIIKSSEDILKMPIDQIR